MPKVKTLPRSVTSARDNTAISPQAMLAWSRVPTRSKDEILASFRHVTQASDANVKTVKVGTQVLKVRRLSSGFRVVYEPGDDRDTIVSVLTPREAGLVRA
jgi:hypothetical protein